MMSYNTSIKPIVLRFSYSVFVVVRTLELGLKPDFEDM